MNRKIRTRSSLSRELHSGDSRPALKAHTLVEYQLKYEDLPWMKSLS